MISFFEQLFQDEPMKHYLLTGMKLVGMGFMLSVISTFFAIRVGKKLNLVDVPEERRLHTVPIPRTGGIALCGITFSF